MSPKEIQEANDVLNAVTTQGNLWEQIPFLDPNLPTLEKIKLVCDELMRLDGEVNSIYEDMAGEDI